MWVIPKQTRQNPHSEHFLQALPCRSTIGWAAVMAIFLPQSVGSNISFSNCDGPIGVFQASTLLISPRFTVLLQEIL